MVYYSVQSQNDLIEIFWGLTTLFISNTLCQTTPQKAKLNKLGF